MKLNTVMMVRDFLNELLNKRDDDEAVDLLVNHGESVVAKFDDEIANHPISIISDMLPYIEAESERLEQLSREDDAYIGPSLKITGIIERAQRAIKDQ